MASDLNKIIIVGRLTRDPELRYTPAGTAVCSFSLANSKTYTQAGEKKEQTSYFDCIAWSKLGELIAEYCKKGKQIAVEGRLQQRRWDDSEGNKKSKIEIVVENFQFLSGGKSEEQAAEQHNGIGTDVTGKAPSFEECSEENPFSDDDIPF